MVKDQEYLEKKASYCLDLAKKLGATDASVNVGSSISETVNFRNKKLDESNRSDNLGVDITSGKFVFNCTEAYEIINGKIGSPIKGATLIGDGPSILKEVSMVGNDMMLDPGIGTCGKAGQGVPVGVAQPSILINKMTVGGTKL